MITLDEMERPSLRNQLEVGMWDSLADPSAADHCMFVSLFFLVGYQKLLRTAKLLFFSLFIWKSFLVKTVQNQHEHIIDRVVTTLEIYHFLDHKAYDPFIFFRT